jgi:hypothetical protein
VVERNRPGSPWEVLLREVVSREVNKLLSEGGLYGHMPHVYEQLDLSFGDLKNIFLAASQGKLEATAEKTDGQNVFFSFNVSTGTLRFARNQSNVRSGGMNLTDIAAKWNNPTVVKAFSEAYTVLDRALSGLPEETLTRVFGPEANNWFSAEIIYSGAVNTIDYGRDVLVLHDSGMVGFRGPGREEVVPEDALRAEQALLAGLVGSMQRNLSDTDWEIHGMYLVDLQQKPEIGARFTSQVDALMSSKGLSDGDTILDFIEAEFAASLSDVPEDLREWAAETFFDPEQTMNDKKRELAEGLALSKAPGWASSSTLTQSIRELRAPIESIVHEFAVELLDGVLSVIALHPDAGVNKLRSQVEAAIQQIETAGDQQALETLGVQLARLRGVERITSSMEGLTFRYGGQMLKLTGNFAPINKILGMLKYRR